MPEREDDDVDSCVVCGEEIDLGDPGNYQHAVSVVVCHACAKKHGGDYDAELENWISAPNHPILKLRMPHDQEY